MLETTFSKECFKTKSGIGKILPFSIINLFNSFSFENDLLYFIRISILMIYFYKTKILITPEYDLWNSRILILRFRIILLF